MIAYDYAPILAARRSWRRHLTAGRIAAVYLIALVLL